MRSTTRMSGYNAELRQAIEAAYDAQDKTEAAVQAVEKLLVFECFLAPEPMAEMCAGGEFYLLYGGKAMAIEEALSVMEANGCITPRDFYNF